MARKKMDASIFSEVGLTGVRQFRGVLEEEFLYTLRGKQGVRVYKEMASNDPIVGGLLHATIQLMRKVPSSIYTSGTSNRELEAREFVASCFNDMSMSWQDIQGEIFSMLPYGWSYFEKVYKIRDGDQRDPTRKSRYSDGKIGFRKFAIRSQETLERWELDEHGGIQGMWQRAPGGEGGERFIPIQKSLLFRTILNSNNPEGKSILRAAYRPWFYKNNFEELLAIGVERDLVGVPTFKAPEGFDATAEENSNLVNNLKKILMNIRRDQQEGLLIPPGWEFALVSSPGSRQFDISELLAYYDKRIALSVLGQFILLGMERVGSFALSSTQSDLFMLSMQGWLSSIDEVVNRFAVDELLKLNGYVDIEKPPYLVHGRIKEYSLDELSVFITRIAKAGLLTPDVQLEELLRMIGGLTEVPERPSIVREAGVHQITHAPVSTERQKRAAGQSIIDSSTTWKEDGETRETASGYMVYVDGSIMLESADLAECFDAAKKYMGRYKENVVGIVRKSWKITGKQEWICDEIVRYIPLKTLEKNDEHFSDWLAGRVHAMTNGLYSTQL